MLKLYLKGTKTFKEDMRQVDGVYYNLYGAKMHTPTARIMWLLACEITNKYPNISAIQLTNHLHDILEQLEKTNGGRF